MYILQSSLTPCTYMYANLLQWLSVGKLEFYGKHLLWCDIISVINIVNNIVPSIQGCKVPDFSLISQTFLLYCRLCYYSFLYALNQDFFAHPITKPPASTREFWSFDLVLQKNFSDPRQNREKRPYPAGTWPAVTRTLSTSQSFQTFPKHNVGNPAIITLNLVKTLIRFLWEYCFKNGRPHSIFCLVEIMLLKLLFIFINRL